MEKDIVTVPQLVAQYPAFTEPTLRWWIFNAETNGFDACLLRIGGRVYVDKVKFEAWLESHRVVPPGGHPVY